MRLTAILMNNVIVYAVAEKYTILKLKQLAEEKFSVRLEEDSMDCGFHKVVSAVFDSTPDSDNGLRNKVSRYFQTYVECYNPDVPFENILRDRGDLGLSIIRRLKKRLSDLRKRISDLVEYRYQDYWSPDKDSLQAKVNRLWEDAVRMTIKDS